MKFIGCFCTTCRSGKEEQCPYKKELGEWTDIDMRFRQKGVPMSLRNLDGVACFFCNATGCADVGNLPKKSRGHAASNVMLLCDGCEKGHHLRCMRHGTFTSVPKTLTWMCHFCTKKRGGCAKCRECDVYDDASKRLLHCDTCTSSWHMHCLPTPLTTEPQSEWYCGACQTDVDPVCTSSCVVTRSHIMARTCGGCGVFIPHSEKDGTSRQCHCCQSLWHSMCLSVSQLKPQQQKQTEKAECKWTCPACNGR